MSAKPEPFEFDIAREFPDGLMVGGVFYPFMVDCFPCNSTGRANVSPARACSTCDGTGQVRNPALEWQQWCDIHSDSAWTDDECSVEYFADMAAPFKPLPDCLMRWIAVGVKEVSE